MNDFKDVFHNIQGGVTIALDGLFPNYPAFGDEVPQNLPERCFIVAVEEPSSRRAFGRRYEVKGTVDIAYYSPLMALDREQELNDVYATVAGGIEVLQCGELKVVLPTKTRGEETAPLHIRCPFTLHIYKSIDDPLMGQITQKEVIK